MTTTLAG